MIWALVGKSSGNSTEYTAQTPQTAEIAKSALSAWNNLNIPILSLSASLWDLLFANWPFGMHTQWLCRVTVSAQHVPLFMSSMAIVAIALDRYRRVIQNHRWDKTGFFLDIFPHAKPTRVGKTLSFFKNSLSLSWNSLSFLKICLSLVKKMSFGAIFLENFHTKLKKLRKNWLLVGKFLSFLTNLLEFLGKIAWVFSGSALSFFEMSKKKAWLYLHLRWVFTAETSKRYV